MPHLFGQICEPSTATHGVEAWTYYLQATRANRSAMQVTEEERKTLGTSGPMLGASSEKQTQLSLFSRTSKDTSNKDSTKSLQTLTSWGAMRNGVFTRRPKPGLHIAGTASSSWPTAVVGDSRSSGRHSTTTGVMHSGTTLTDAISTWPTPNACLINDSESPESFLKRQEKWAHVYHNSVPLTVRVKQWPTAGANDYKGSSQPGQRRGQLDEAAEQIHSHLGQKEIGQRSEKTSTPRLNPRFVEWLMGFPYGWISLEPLEMRSVHSKQQ